MPNWLKTTLKIAASLILLITLLVIGASLYITFRKDKFLKLVNAELDKSVDGTFIIGNLHPEFFKRFPNISLGLDNVLLRDKRFTEHHHTLLNAKNFDVSVNTADLFTGTISINHIDISNAAIDLYTDSLGYSNTAVLKNKAKKNNNQTSKSTAPEIGKFTLTNVGFKVDDQKANKLFDFVINDLDGKMTYPDSGWHATFHLDVIAKSMAFSTTHGSFIKQKELQGDFVAGCNKNTGKINVQAKELYIGNDPFNINALFDTGKPDATFMFHIACKELLWRHASSLLAQNITLKLNQFNMAKPIGVKAIISGSFNGGDPYLYVTASVKNNTIIIPGSTLDNCTFEGVFTNSYLKGNGLTDENSVIRLVGLTGSYHHIPFNIDTGSIINLTKPIATGNFTANFPVADLNYLLGAKVARFSKGSISAKLRYRADIVDYRINKPVISGSIDFKNADINYLASNLLLKNTSFSLDFVGNDLLLSNIRLQTGRSIAYMNGRVNNFLNLYYNSPEKILLTWNIHSPQMYLAEFLGLLAGGGRSDKPKSANSGNAIDQLSNVMQKGSARMNLDVANLHYNKFLATNVSAMLLTSPNGVAIQNVGLKTAGGTLKINGNIKKSGAVNRLSLNTIISDVNVRDFFEAFDNFGMTDFTAQNLRGKLSANTQITAAINNKAALIDKSVNGNLDLTLTNAALLNFKPLVSVGKYASHFAT